MPLTYFWYCHLALTIEEQEEEEEEEDGKTGDLVHVT